MTAAPFWTHSKQAFRDDEYSCSVCGYVSAKPYPECPGCRSMMTGSRYASEWIDETEKNELFPEEEENVASRLTSVFEGIGRMVTETVRKAYGYIRAYSEYRKNERENTALPYCENSYRHRRKGHGNVNKYKRPGKKVTVEYDPENYERALRLLADLRILKRLHDSGTMSDSMYIEEIDENLEKLKTRY